MRRIIHNSLGMLAAAVLLLGFTLVAGGTAASAQPAGSASVTPKLGSGFNAIRNVGDNLCLEPEGQSTVEFASIVQEPCVTSGLESIAQGWEYIRTGTNHFRFKNQLSGFCFDAFDGAFNGARLLQGTCVPISNEEYNTGTSLPAVTKIESRERFRDTGYCVDVPGAQWTPGLAMQIYRCNGTPAQVWVIGF
jgi:hypothetical protein